jgi:hypothetical protein
MDKPTASASIEPLGPRAHSPRGHAVRLHLELKDLEPRFADRVTVVDVARRALAELCDDRAAFVDVLGGKARIIGVEGSIVCADKPNADSLARLQDTLSGAGYLVKTREVRECSEETCASTAVMDPNRAESAPATWFGAHICGKHGYRACLSCTSIYVMTSANAAGQAPSVHCEVCGAILVEWGGTKLWSVELVTRGERSS